MNDARASRKFLKAVADMARGCIALDEALGEVDSIERLVSDAQGKLDAVNKQIAEAEETDKQRKKASDGYVAQGRAKAEHIVYDANNVAKDAQARADAADAHAKQVVADAEIEAAAIIKAAQDEAGRINAALEQIRGVAR